MIPLCDRVTWDRRANRARPATLDRMENPVLEVKRVIAAVEDLKDIEENWEQLDVKVKLVKRVKLANEVSKGLLDLKANRYQSNSFLLNYLNLNFFKQ